MRRVYTTHLTSETPLTARQVAEVLGDFGFNVHNANWGIRPVRASPLNDFTAFEGTCQFNDPHAGQVRLELAARDNHHQGRMHEVSVTVITLDDAGDTSAFPPGYRPDNVLGALIDAAHDRFDGYYTRPQIAGAIAARFGDGDYGCAEDALWGQIGPVIDTIEDGVRDQLQTVRLPAP